MLLVWRTQVFLVHKDIFVKTLKSFLPARESLFERKMYTGYYHQQQRQNQSVSQCLFRVFMHLTDSISLYNKP